MDNIQNIKTKSKYLMTKIILGLLLGSVGIAAVNIFTFESVQWGIETISIQFLKGVLFSGIVLLGVWLIRVKLDSTKTAIGFDKPKNWLKKIGFGMGLIIVPITLTLIITNTMGWAAVHINTSGSFLFTFFLGMASTFLTDALPEEVLFRGFVYSSFNQNYNKLVSSACSIVLFALFPFLMVIIQKDILGHEVYIGGNNQITVGYFITMIFFGSFMQYLRILTKSVWTSIGFHTIFVFMNTLIGIESTSLIQFTGFEREIPMQITLISLLVIVFVGLLIYPRISKNPINWKGTLHNNAG